LFLCSAPAARALPGFGPSPSAPLLRDSSLVCTGCQTELVVVFIFFVWFPAVRQSGLVPESRARVRPPVSSIPCEFFSIPGQQPALLHASSCCCWLVHQSVHPGQRPAPKPSFRFVFLPFSDTYESCVWFVAGAHTGCVLEPPDQRACFSCSN
jgi:hypothetical protein